MRYTEDVHSARPFTVSARAGALVLFGWGIWLLVMGAGAIGVAALFVAAVVLAVVSRVFGVLRLDVGGDGFRARFGPWGLNIALDEIEEARAERYSWLSHGGWGLRWGRRRGRSGRACSVPFPRTGIVVDTVGGRRHYVTTRRPDDPAAAVNQHAAEARHA